MATAPPRSKLITAVVEASEGKASNEQLLEVVAAARQSVQTMREDFLGSLEDLEPRVREAIQDYTNMALGYLDRYEECFDLLEAYTRTNDRNDLFRGGDLAFRLQESLDAAFVFVRNAALVAMGPTAIPTLNLILNAWAEVQDGNPLDKLVNVVNQERMAILGSMDELKSAPKNAEFDALRAAYDQHLRCMNRLANALRDEDGDQAAREIEQARHTFAQLRVLIPEAEMAARTATPTPSPHVNLVLNLGRDFLDVKVHQDVFMESVKILERLVEQSREALSLRSDLLSADDQERATEALANFDGAFSDIREFLKNREGLVLEGALNRLRDSAEVLSSVQNTLLAALGASPN